jgi:hypothetical protein
VQLGDERVDHHETDNEGEDANKPQAGSGTPAELRGRHRAGPVAGELGGPRNIIGSSPARGGCPSAVAGGAVGVSLVGFIVWLRQMT